MGTANHSTGTGGVRHSRKAQRPTASSQADVHVSEQFRHRRRPAAPAVERQEHQPEWCTADFENDGGELVCVRDSLLRVAVALGIDDPLRVLVMSPRVSVGHQVEEGHRAPAPDETTHEEMLGADRRTQSERGKISIELLLTARDENGSTALHIACEQNMEALVPVFLDAGYVVNARDSQDCTPLFTAVRAGASTGLLKLLIDRGARPDVGPTGEPTALMLAAGMGCLPTVQLLATAGADIFASADNLEGQTALHLAAANGCTVVTEFLLLAGCLSAAPDSRGRTPVMAACANGRVGTASMLLSGEGWALPYLPDSDEFPRELKQLVLSFLVASADRRNEHDGNSPLLEACDHRGTPEIVDLLAEHGAEISCTNALGETALHVACRRGNARIVHHLLGMKEKLSRGAPSLAEALEARDSRGRRPGEAKDVDVGVHEVMAVKEVIACALEGVHEGGGDQ